LINSKYRQIIFQRYIPLWLRTQEKDKKVWWKTLSMKCWESELLTRFSFRTIWNVNVINILKLMANIKCMWLSILIGFVMISEENNLWQDELYYSLCQLLSELCLKKMLMVNILRITEYIFRCSSHPFIRLWIRSNGQERKDNSHSVKQWEFQLYTFFLFYRWSRLESCGSMFFWTRTRQKLNFWARTRPGPGRT